jgi:diguanylate cyclase (GGDEF)-like protein
MRTWQNFGIADPGESRHVSVRLGKRVVLLAAMGAVLSIAAFVALWLREERVADLQFHVRAKNAAIALQGGIEGDLNQLTALRALFDGGHVSRSQFDVFASELLDEKPAILSVSWIPRVDTAGRAAHEQEAVGEGFADYQIRAVTPKGLVRAPDRAEHLPVYYTSEKAHSRTVLGLDLADGGIRQRALERARDMNRLAASDLLTLQSGEGDRRGFFVALPLYRQGAPRDTAAERRENLIGFVQGVFQTSRMVEKILGEIRIPADLYLYAPDNDIDPVYILPSADIVQPRSMPELVAGRHLASAIKVADTVWTLVAVPVPQPVANHVQAWLVLIAGLLLSAATTSHMWSSTLYATRLERANERISELAAKDPLTCLSNRRAFLERLGERFAVAQKSGSRFSVLYCDLDHFKDINDTLGHSAGDALLRQVAERLTAVVAAKDIVARFGSDEFALLHAPADGAEPADALANRVIAALTAPYSILDNELHITASIGISTFSLALANADSMMMQADLALNHAKELGRNCFYHHTEALDQAVRERVEIAEELRTALRRGELEVHYQPQVELASGRIIGLEALVRWSHPHRGMVPPSVFIPVAEHTGLIVELGRWVFDETCRQVRIWSDAGIAPNTVAVNVSAVQCQYSDLIKDTAESLARWVVQPSAIEIELTESVLMASLLHGDMIERLRQLGLRIAIDDFGTGYSSLSYLTSYPVDRLKVAQELVFKVDAGGRHACVVRAAILLAEELGIELVAEGVETDSQASFLVEAGCLLGQGYLFGRPMSAEQTTEFLRSKFASRMPAPLVESVLVAA